MYKQFYGLSKNPFEINPDPAFFYPTPQHNEAWASLLYGIKKRKGFVVVTGEVGTGKTLLIQCALQWLNKSRIAFSHIFNPRLSVLEFLQYFTADLGLPIADKNKSGLLIQLNQYLIGCYRKGSTAVLIVDEGQLLGWDVLEEIRLLTNLETVQQKLLQIVLVGQPELERKLDSADLRQLKQRVSLRCRLEPLSEEQVKKYISRRLEVAGAKEQGNDLFSEPALALIFRYSKGLPRLINTICESALITGYAGQLRSITPEVIEQVAIESRLNVGPPAEPPGKTPDNENVLKQLFEMVRLLEKAESGKEPSKLVKEEAAGAEA
jgi:type II secretory pathway predicted ATPase ExeA